MDRLLATPGSRVVTVSSVGHRMGDIYFDDLAFERGYRRMRAYGQSKLANLMFTYELPAAACRRSRRATTALAAHPGSSWTELQRHTPFWMSAIAGSCPATPQRWGPSPRCAPRPTRRRAAPSTTAPEAGANGPATVRVQSSARSRDIHAQYRLWELSEQLTGVTYQIPSQAPHYTAAPGTGRDS